MIIISVSYEDISHIFHLFHSISVSGDDDGVIDYEEFCKTIDLPKSLFTKQLFRLFDNNDNESINFRKFIVTLSTLVYGTTNERLKVGFRLYDVDRNGLISKQELRSLLTHCVLGPHSTSQLSSETLDSIVHQSFVIADLDLNDQLDFEEFCVLAEKHPSMISTLKVDPDDFFSIIR